MVRRCIILPLNRQTSFSSADATLQYREEHPLTCHIFKGILIYLLLWLNFIALEKSVGVCRIAIYLGGLSVFVQSMMFFMLMNRGRCKWRKAKGLLGIHNSIQ